MAVLACSSVRDGTASVRRGLVARALLGAVTFSTCGRLILGVSGHSSHELRQELLALAGALTEEVRGTTVTVSLRFAEASRGRAVRTMETTSESNQGQAPELRHAASKT